MEAEIPKVYSPESIEPRWARAWIEQKLYRPSDDATRPRFCLVIPPPNITGSLHMGHMLEHTLIDIAVRWHRMRGEDVLWLPGTDHAAIATQMIVEQELGREALKDDPKATKSDWRRVGQSERLKMGREKFLERCWKWKEENGGTIRRQMERMGASVDWTRERFTMDPAYVRAVVEVFVRLYDEGLIYRGKYMVNWCPRCGTAVSDLEVVHEERQGHLWYIRYPFEDRSGHLTVATTRPETMLGDTAVAVNPADERYRGRKVVLPLTNRVIPVIEDDIVVANFGTGVMKVTPAHDPSDYTVAERHKLPSISVIDEQARMTAEAGPYQGLDRYQAREAVLKDLADQGLLEKTEDLKFSIPICQRCHTVVEPLLSTQWFMKMRPLAAPAIQVVEEGRIRILPDNYRKIYLDWMGRIYDWCVSRQLWWGHRIPAWYCDGCGEVIVARETPSACPNCRMTTLRPETDTLDTWFSSALWPFATLGWPDAPADLARFYPNDLMIMGFDILFFWGARMIMMGLKFMRDVPFRELYIHALLRDAERQKMSKTKGNVLDPLQVTEQYGTDAVRFALAISAPPGTDIAFSKDKVESYRAFANKIWNAARFVLMNLENLPEPMRDQLASLQPIPGLGVEPVAAPENLALADRWIFSRLYAVTCQMDEALAGYRFHEAAHTIYHFFWHEFCDWYLEWVKPEITRPPEGNKVPAAWINLTRVFQAALRLLHPFMPFITEELWHRALRAGHEPSISVTAFRTASERASDPVSEGEFSKVHDLIVAARNAKAEMGLQTEKPSAQVACDNPRTLELFRAHQETILRLAGLRALNFTRERLETEVAGVRQVNQDTALRLLHEEKVDAEAERLRLEREKQKLEQQLGPLEKQLGNESFLSRAPEDVVRGARQRHAELTSQHRKLLESIERLGPPPA